jgi:hypothetical protein
MTYGFATTPTHQDSRIGRSQRLRESNKTFADIQAGDSGGPGRRCTASVDAVLLFGPLYHLPDRTDRLAVWRTHRVLRPTA